MIKDIVKDVETLSKKCRLVTKKDKEELVQLVQNMTDTAISYEEPEGCVGLAANQIGSNLRVILVKIYGTWTPMVNPTIVNSSNSTFTSKEGCLSLEGMRTVKRHTWVDVIYTPPLSNKARKITATGEVAAIVQHEIDHLNGRLI